MKDASQEALDRLRVAVRGNPRSTTFVALAHALCDAGESVEAEEVARSGLGEHPGLVTGQVALGRSLFDRGRLRDAQQVLVEAAQSNPEHGDIFLWLGEVIRKRGDLTRARAILEYAEELLPYEARVAELLVEVGGTPTYRAPRPKSDFEDTRVNNARGMAERMLSESTPVRSFSHEPPKAPDPSVRVPALLLDDATVVDSPATSGFTMAASVPKRPPTGAFLTLPASPVPVPASAPLSALSAAYSAETARRRRLLVVVGGVGAVLVAGLVWFLG